MNEFLSSIGIGSGRLLPTVAAVVGLIGVIISVFAMARSRRAGDGPSVAIVAAALGLISLIIGGLHTANSAGSFGTGNGLAGAIAAIVLGLIGMVLGGLAVARARPRELDSHPSGSGPQKMDSQPVEKKENQASEPR
jgi:xanthosine utilization system XapX-like protein